MTITDSTYYKRRAAQELELADASAEPEVARIHAKLAEEYLTRAAEQAEPDLPSAKLETARRSWR